MKKKFLLTLIIMIFGVLVFGAFSVSAATSGNFTYKVSNGTATITKCSTSAVGDITIPSFLGEYDVTAIGNSAFDSCTGLTSITIPKRITSIGTSCFNSCSNLINIFVDNNNPNYTDENGILYSKDMTMLVKYPEGRTADSFVIPDDVHSLDKYAFYDVVALRTITLPDNVVNMDEGAFQSCDNLESVNFSDEITSIGKYTFLNCKNLKDISFSNKITTIANYAFSGCDNLENVYYAGNEADWGKITIGYGNDSLNNATIHYSVYVTFVDENGQMISNIPCIINASLEEDMLPNKKGYKLSLYTDVEMTKPFDMNSNITQDLLLCVKYSSPLEMSNNGALITGAKEVTVGEENINYTVFIQTKMEDILYSTLYIKYPNELVLNNIEAVGFEVVDVEDTTTEGDYSISKIVAIYSNSGKTLPNEILIEAFNLSFNASTYMLPGRATIDITTDSVIMSSKVDYDFDGLYGTSFDILPKLAEGISIVGDETIENKTKYSAVLSPDYATNKNVEWSVSDPAVAIIEQDGTLKPVSNGTVTLTARTLDGSNLKASKDITVYAKTKIDTITTNLGDWDIPFDSDNRKYIIYVPFDTSAIDITTSFDGGTLKINGNIAFNERAKTITLSGIDTTITMIRSGVENCIDSAYVLNVVKTKPFVKTLISDNKNTFYSRAYCLGSDNTMYFALYDDNKLVSVQTDSVSEGKTSSFTADIDHDNVKIMVWNDKLAPQTDVTKYNYEGLNMSGEGTESSPYLISNIEQLKSIKNNLNAHYRLINDITFAENDKWTPLGTSEQYFAGTFDGNFHKIKGLNVVRNRSDQVSYSGLFAYNRGTIKNVVLEDVSFKCVVSISDGSPYIYVGAISAINSGNIFNCTVSGEIYADTVCRHSISTYCYPSIYAGGIASRNYSNGVISGCSSNVTIIAEASCDAMSPRGSYAYVGGVAGDNSGSIVNCKNSGELSGYGSGAYKEVSVGGICGDASGRISGCVNMGIIDTNDEIGGIVADLGNVQITNCYWLDTTVEGTIADKAYTTSFNNQEKNDVSKFANLDFDSCWIMGKDGPSLSIQ